MILRTTTDIFPSIIIPVVAMAWTYMGLSPEESERRITTLSEQALTTLVDNIEHFESAKVNGNTIVKIYLQPSASIDRANAQVTAVSQTIVRQLPPGSLPRSSLTTMRLQFPSYNFGLSGKGLTEPQLNFIALNFLRTQLVTVPGATIPFPFGGKNSVRSFLKAREFHKQSPTELRFLAISVGCFSGGDCSRNFARHSARIRFAISFPVAADGL